MTKEQLEQAEADRLGDELRIDGYRSPMHKKIVEDLGETLNRWAGGRREVE